MEITIQEGLNELKLLEKRIQKGTQALVPTVIYTEREASNKSTKLSKFNTVIDSDEFVKKAKGDIDSVKALIKRRASIKSAISKANAVTEVDIHGVKMTIAEAIDRKLHIELEKDLYTTLHNSYRLTLIEVDKYNAEISRLNETLLNEEVKRENSSEPIADRIAKLNTQLQKREASILSGITDEPDGSDVPSYIEEKLNELTDFEASFALALTVANVTTKITIPE